MSVIRKNAEAMLQFMGIIRIKLGNQDKIHPN